MVIDKIKKFQHLERMHWILYSEFSKISKNPENSSILEELSKIEELHYSQLKNFTKSESKVSKFRLALLLAVGKILGIRFVLKYLERNEDKLKNEIIKLVNGNLNELPSVLIDQNQENELAEKLYDEKLLYVSAIILGLNDALVELSGALAGYTLAIPNSRLIAVIGLITGIAAALSMAIAEYLSIKEDTQSHLNCNRAAIYTGITYMITVFLLISPYFLNISKYAALGIMVLIDISLVFLFNYYIAVTTDTNLGKKFIRMTSIVLSVAFISFLVGYAVQKFFNINI